MKVTSFITLCLLLMFALGVYMHACFSDQNYVFLQFWYFNSANVHQSYLGLDLLAMQGNAAVMSMVGEFDLYDINQYLRFWIDSTPMSNETQWAGLTIQVKGTFLNYVNGSREYSNIYNNTIVVKPEPIQGVDRIEYFFNFSNEIQKVKEQVYPEQPLQNIGIFGSLALDTTIRGVVGQVGTQNYIKLALHADSESPYGWVLIPSITIPETAQWQIAKIDAVDMIETFPDLRGTTLTVTQGTGNDHQIYAVWQTSAPLSWQDQMTKFPISLGWGLLIGLITGLSSRYIYDKLHRKKRSVTANNTTHNELKAQPADVKEQDQQDDMQRLVKFVDENFQPIGLKDVLEASAFFRAVIIALIILLVYLVGLSLFTPLVYQIPWAISFVAVLMATASLAKALQREVQTSLVKLRMEQMSLRLGSADERTKCLLYSLLSMKIRNSNLKLSLLYEMDKSLFETEKLLERLYEV